jgi:hypothetical protein
VAVVGYAVAHDQSIAVHDGTGLRSGPTDNHIRTSLSRFYRADGIVTRALLRIMLPPARDERHMAYHGAECTDIFSAACKRLSDEACRTVLGICLSLVGGDFAADHHSGQSVTYSFEADDRVYCLIYTTVERSDGEHFIALDVVESQDVGLPAAGATEVPGTPAQGSAPPAGTERVTVDLSGRRKRRSKPRPGHLPAQG